MHIPGLKVVMPSTPYDVKGLMVSSIQDGNPVMFIEHRWLYEQIGYVPEEIYTVPIGKGIVRRQGKDVTVVAVSNMVYEAMKAVQPLEAEGIDVEVIDPRTIKPLDEEINYRISQKDRKACGSRYRLEDMRCVCRDSCGSCRKGI